MFKKKIYFSDAKDKYCLVKLFRSRWRMQRAYQRRRPDDMKVGEFVQVLGAHCGYTRIMVNTDRSERIHPEVGTVYLCAEGCGAGVISHEFMHAAIWAWRHRSGKSQYPVMIMNIEEEEELLYMLTQAVSQFYCWYWKIEKYL